MDAMGNKSKRVRLNLSVTAEESARLEGLTERYGFRSTCCLARWWLNQLCMFEAGIMPDFIDPSGLAVADEIAEMFAELSRGEPTPADTVPTRERRRRQ